jgi:hypothetical protein
MILSGVIATSRNNSFGSVFDKLMVPRLRGLLDPLPSSPTRSGSFLPFFHVAALPNGNWSHYGCVTPDRR